MSKKKLLTKLQKVTKKYGFFQYKKMAERFKIGKGLAYVRKGDHPFHTRVYLYKRGKGIEKIAEKLNQVRVKKFDELARHVYQKQPLRNRALRRIKKEGFDMSSFLENYKTNGYTSKTVMSIAGRKNIKSSTFKRYKDMIGRSSYRHKKTPYDLIDKRGMSDYEIRELRRRFSKK